MTMMAIDRPNLPLMTLSRRQWLQIASGVAAGAFLGSSEVSATTQPKPKPYLYSASDHPAGGHFLTRMEATTGTLAHRPTPLRGHAPLVLADGRVLLLARRPGVTCAVLDFMANANTPATPFTARPERHFNGHGCLSNDGTLLFTSENDYAGKRGVIGIRDSQSFAWIGEYHSGGLDPHDLQLLPDGNTLVVANGGIETHPDFGRRKLNPDTLQPSLAYLDAHTGKLLAEHRLSDRQLSIRHLSITPKGDVAVALQYEGDLYRTAPASLLAWQPAGGELRLIPTPAAALVGFQGYLADVAYDPTHGILASASPRGNRVGFWHSSGQFLYAIPLPEPSGIAYVPDAAAFWVSTTTGSIYQIPVSLSPTTPEQLQHDAEVVWDNHLWWAG